MKNLEKRKLENSLGDELNLDELLLVEGGVDTDSDEDECTKQQCKTGAITSCYTRVNG